MRREREEVTELTFSLSLFLPSYFCFRNAASFALANTITIRVISRFNLIYLVPYRSNTYNLYLSSFPSFLYQKSNPLSALYSSHHFIPSPFFSNCGSLTHPLKSLLNIVASFPYISLYIVFLFCMATEHNIKISSSSCMQPEMDPITVTITQEEEGVTKEWE